MKLILLTVLTLTVVSASVDVLKKRQFGLCVEMCTPGVTNTGCPHGHLCVGNGCGHVCQIILPLKRAMCLGAMCNSYCIYGHKASADGCPTCACNEGPVV